MFIGAFPFVAAVVRPVEAVEDGMRSNAHRAMTIQSTRALGKRNPNSARFGHNGGGPMRCLGACSTPLAPSGPGTECLGVQPDR
jgi:hypothetical protein